MIFVKKVIIIFVIKFVKQGTKIHEVHTFYESYTIYKSLPFMPWQSRFLEAPLVRQVDGNLKKGGQF